MRTIWSGPAYEAEKKRAALKSREIYPIRKASISQWHKDHADRVRQIKMEWRLRNREKVRANRRLQKAVLSGDVLVDVCKVCGTLDEIEAHHDDYSKPLEVVWLCKVHHGATRRKY
jgi:hypothetical protein